MKTTLHYVLAAGAASCLAISAAAAETRDYDFSGFTMVSAAEGVNVEVSVGGDYAVRAEGDADKLDKLRIAQRGDTLRIDRRNSGWFQMNRRSDFTVYVETPALEGVKVSSGADLTASGIDAGRFTASVSSGADARLSGTCDTIEAKASSGADLEAEDLECAHATADASSGADITVYASESVDADASSGGDITVRGGPQRTNVNESSGGDVHIRN